VIRSGNGSNASMARSGPARELACRHGLQGGPLHIRDVREFASSGVVLPRNIGLVAEK
jgi:hypothetical protein